MDKDQFFATDPCPYLVKYPLDVLKKKTKLIRIRFLKINGFLSLVIIQS